MHGGVRQRHRLVEARDLSLAHTLVAANDVFDLDRGRGGRVELFKPSGAAYAGRVDAVLGRQHGHHQHDRGYDERDDDTRSRR